MLNRRGVTLVELLVSMALLGVIGSAAVGALLQQTRLRTRMMMQAAAEVQLRGAVAPLLADLAAVSPSEGDIPPGEARDTTLELRATRGEGFVCAAMDSVVHVAMLSPPRGRDAAAGDMIWLYEGGKWAGGNVADAEWVDSAPAGCTAAAGDGRVLRIEHDAPGTPVAGRPVRFTRRLRYSFYRAGDGGTYLGLKEWSATLGAFAGLQPVAGPFDRRHSSFQYHDSLGAELLSGTAQGPEIAAVTVRIGAGSLPGGPARASSARTRDTVAITVMLRNRR